MTEYFFKLRVKNLGKNGRKIISPDIRQSCSYPVVVLGQIIYSVIFLFKCSPNLSPLKKPVPVSLEFLVLMGLLVNTQRFPSLFALLLVAVARVPMICCFLVCDYCSSSLSC